MGVSLIVLGAVGNAAGSAVFLVLAAANLLFIGLDDSGRTRFEAPRVLLWGVLPGTLLIACGALLAARRAEARARLIGILVLGSIVLGLGAGVLFLMRFAR